jgi:L-alanine-DL-glutamate epimerase-like enolase superfamily enzyme
VKIIKVEAIPLDIPYNVPVTLSFGTCEVQNSVLVRVTGEDGTYGLGETQPSPFFHGCGETQSTILALIRSVYTPILLGEDAFNIERLYRAMEKAVGGGEYARAAVSDALYDLVARALDIPLYALLGGRCRERIPVVWPIGMNSSEEMAKEAKRAKSRGYFLFKCKIGTPDPAVDLANVEAIRNAIGSSTPFHVDANASLSYSDALQRLGKMAATNNLRLLEQPLPIWDLDGMARLSDVLGVPVMADESARSTHSVLEIVKRGAASVIDVKLAKMGGVHAARKIAAIADAAGIPLYAGGQVATSVGAATAAHFYAAVPHLLGGDFQAGPGGWLASDIVRDPLVIREGHALIPEDGPGIGVELDEDMLREVRVNA